VILSNNDDVDVDHRDENEGSDQCYEKDDSYGDVDNVCLTECDYVASS